MTWGDGSDGEGDREMGDGISDMWRWFDGTGVQGREVQNRGSFHSSIPRPVFRAIVPPNTANYDPCFSDVKLNKNEGIITSFSGIMTPGRGPARPRAGTLRRRMNVPGLYLP